MPGICCNASPRPAAGCGNWTGPTASFTARRSVQAMDRLVVELNKHGVTMPGAAQGLDTLFADVRVPEAFSADKFARDLDQFSASMGRL